VTGWMKFTGLKRKVKFDLEGDFHLPFCIQKFNQSGGIIHEIIH